MNSITIFEDLKDHHDDYIIPSQNNTYEEFKTKSYEELKEMDQVNIRDSELYQDLFLMFGDNFNGMILSKTTQEVVCAPATQLIDITKEEADEFVLNNTDMEFCEDGTVIKMYFYNNEWITATNKCIDARFSFWNSPKSFNELFYELFDSELTNSMNTEFTYFFILTHQENQIVIQHDTNRLFYLYKINNKTFEKSIDNELNFDIPENTCQYSPNFLKRGIIFKSNNIEYKYDFSCYTDQQMVRGNTPRIIDRYIQLLSDDTVRDRLIKLYPNYLLLFKIVDKDINNLSNYIHQLYFNTHIKHTFQLTEDCELYSNEYYIMKTIKNMHYTYKTHGIVMTKQATTNIIKNLPFQVITKLLNYKN
jgi:hypothetical protein